jgi:hypothetical protein
MFVAFVDDLVCVLTGQQPSYKRSACDNPEDRHAAHE